MVKSAFCLRHARQYARLAAAGALLLVCAYVTAALLIGSVPTNRAWRPPASGIVIYVESNGIHTDLIVPKRAAGIDWTPLARARDLGDPRYATYDHLAIGWGERSFYLETPTWADLKLRTLLGAGLGSVRTLVHVEHLPRPTPGTNVRAITLRPQEYRRLAAFIESYWNLTAKPHPGYGAWDAFYESRGRYDAARTCNSWTGTALAYAGVRVGVWTPFADTVMGWFPAPPPSGSTRRGDR